MNPHERTTPRARGARVAAALAPTLLLAACAIIISKDPAPSDHDPSQVTLVESAARVHLADGSVVVYDRGFTIARDTIVGRGSRWGLTLKDEGDVSRVPVDSVIAMESYPVETNTGRSAGYSLAASGAIWGGLVVLCAALCGSCPTIYGPDGTLEAEAFSYSIAPMFEARDVDRLSAEPGPDGVLVLDVRNEMLETHYLNRFELVEVAHAGKERVAVDPLGRPLAFTDLSTPVRAIARDGKDLSELVASLDEKATRASDHTLAAAEMDDWIEISASAPAGADSVALLLHLRNSPLSTILLYEVMLGGQGPGAVDWVGRELGRVDRALELGSWYTQRMGLRVTARDGRPLGRIGDVGPIAWKEVAVVVPVEEDSVHIRLSFVADAWRIDRIALGAAPRRAVTRVLLPSAVSGADGISDEDAVERLQLADDRYVETRPGERFALRFEVGPGSGKRTFLLASTGYYVEWIRGAWLDVPVASFDPSDAALVEALRRWRVQREEYEAAFLNTRFPIEGDR